MVYPHANLRPRRCPKFGGAATGTTLVMRHMGPSSKRGPLSARSSNSVRRRFHTLAVARRAWVSSSDAVRARGDGGAGLAPCNGERTIRISRALDGRRGSGGWLPASSHTRLSLARNDTTSMRYERAACISGVNPLLSTAHTSTQSSPASHCTTDSCPDMHAA